MGKKDKDGKTVQTSQTINLCKRIECFTSEDDLKKFSLLNNNLPEEIGLDVSGPATETSSQNGDASKDDRTDSHGDMSSFNAVSNIIASLKQVCPNKSWID